MSKEYFQYQQTKSIHSLFEQIGSFGFSRGKVFEDFLTMTICALSGEQMEQEYLEVAARYSQGERGKRPIDILASLFGVLVDAMEESKADILGDYFMGAITFGEHGQFYTPECLTDMMASMVHSDQGETVSDPCCGSGRMLLSAAKINPKRKFIGQDLDLRCVQMTAINLALNGLRGEVIWGNTLANEQRLVYATGFNGRGFIKALKVTQNASPQRSEDSGSGEQLSLLAA